MEDNWDMEWDDAASFQIDGSKLIPLSGRTIEDDIRWKLMLIHGEKEAFKRMTSDPELAMEMVDKLMAVDLDAIEKWLKWLLAFVQFFNAGFKDKNGDYRKPGFWKWASIITSLLPLGLKLLGIKKIK